MDTEIMTALTQFGVAGLICWMWLVEDAHPPNASDRSPNPTTRSCSNASSSKG